MNHCWFDNWAKCLFIIHTLCFYEKPWSHGVPKVLQQRVRASRHSPLQGDPSHRQK